VCGDEDLFKADLLAGAGLGSSMALKYSAPMAEWSCSWLFSSASVGLLLLCLRECRDRTTGGDLVRFTCNNWLLVAGL